MGFLRCASFLAWWHTIINSLPPANAALSQQARRAASLHTSHAAAAAHQSSPHVAGGVA